MSNLILPFDKKVALGQIDGAVKVDKFGETISLDSADLPIQIWDRNHNLVYVTTATEFYISSSNNADTIKVNIVIMTGFKKYVPVQVTLQGNTPVAISVEGVSPDPDFCEDCGFLRSIRMKPDNGSVSLGDVYLASTNVGTVAGVPLDANIQAWFSIAKQQTQMSQFSIPLGYYGLLTELFIGIINEGNTSATNADVTMHSRSMSSSAFINKWSLPLSSGGSIIIPKTAKFLKPGHDIYFGVNAVGRSSTKLTCSYTVELYREDKINTPIVLD